MPFGIRARGRKKRTQFQQAAHINRLYNSQDPGVRALEPARTKARIRGIRNVAKGQHTAQAEMIRRAQDQSAEQERQNEFQRRRLVKQDKRQAARDKENDFRFRLLRGDRLKTADEVKSAAAKNQLDQIGRSLAPGAPRRGVRTTAGAPARRTLAPTRTAKPVELVRGELPKQPSKTPDYWFSALGKFSPAASKQLTAGFGMDPIQGLSGDSATATDKFGAGIEATDAIARHEQLRMRNTYLDALDEYSRRNPQGTEADAVRFAAKAAGLDVPTQAEEAAGVKELFGDDRTTMRKRLDRRAAAGRREGKAEIRTRRSLSPQGPNALQGSGVGVGEGASAGELAQPATDLTQQSSGGGAPWPGGREPQWYKDRVAARRTLTPAGATGTTPTLGPRSPIETDETIRSGNVPGAADNTPISVTPAAATPPVRRSLTPQIIPNTTFPGGAPYVGPVAEPAPAVPGSAGYEDVANAAVGVSPSSLLSRARNLVSGGTDATKRDEAITSLQRAQQKLRSGQIPADQRDLASQAIQAINQLMNKANRTPEEDQLLKQGIDRLNALYGG